MQVLGLHADHSGLQGLLGEVPEVLLVGHLLEQVGQLWPAVVAGLIGCLSAIGGSRSSTVRGAASAGAL